jgi:monoterpene epsilon-lactone hydrolase
MTKESPVVDRVTTPVTRVPARDIPVPDYLSPAARAALAAPLLPDMVYPPRHDIEAWRALVVQMEAALLPMILGGAAQLQADVQERDANGVRVFMTTPHGMTTERRGVILDIHGGALILGGGAACRAVGIGVADRLRSRVWSVDYRMPPDHPYPAPLDDCLEAYRALLGEHGPEEIIVYGMSAGGNLAAALILRARDEGLPLPAGAILVSPEVDLTESGDSFRTNLNVDAVPGSLMPVNLLYAAEHDLRHPYLSPLFGDFGKGFPPTILTTGTRDLFLSNTVRMHRALRAAGVPAELHVLDAAGHMGFPGAPEGEELEREIRRFVHQIGLRAAPQQHVPSAPLAA